LALADVVAVDDCCCPAFVVVVSPSAFTVFSFWNRTLRPLDVAGADSSGVAGLDDDVGNDVAGLHDRSRLGGVLRRDDGDSEDSSLTRF